METILASDNFLKDFQNLHQYSDTIVIYTNTKPKIPCSQLKVGSFVYNIKQSDDEAKKLFSVGITPIICVGETLQERENNLTEKIITTQITEVLAGFSEKEIQHSIIAYEPVWAIGTGKTATPQQAEEVHKLIRTLLAKQFSQKIAEKIVIQYGGSVKPENAKDLLSQSNIDGALVGGACLDVDSFVKIISSC